MSARDVVELALERSGLRSAAGNGDRRASLYRLSQVATELRLGGIDRALLDGEAVQILEGLGERNAGKLVEAALAIRHDVRATEGAAEPQTLTHIGELLSEPQDAVSWIVDGLLPAGGLSVLAGKPKAGKSTTARALALRVSRGEAFLGRATTAGPVIYLGLEDPRRVTRGHFEALGARPTDQLWVFTGARPDEALLWLEGVLATVDPVLLVADTLQHLLGISDLNDYARVVTALRPILALVRPRRTHALLVHHAGKGERVGFDAVLGSTAIVGTADVVLLERRREDKTRTLATLQRAGEDLDETVLVLNEHQEPTLGPSRQDYDVELAGERVLAWLRDQPEPVARKDILAAVDARAEHVVQALNRLVGATKLIRAGKGQKGDPFRYAVPESLYRAGNGIPKSPEAQQRRDEFRSGPPGNGGNGILAEHESEESPAGGGNGIPGEQESCPSCRSPMYHIGSEPDRSWVCLACHPEVKAALRGPEGAGLPVEHLADVRCPACEMMMTDWADKLGLPTPMLVCAFCDPKTQAAYRHQAFQLGEGRP